MNNYFVFDRKPSSDFGCFLVADSIHESPKRDYKKVSVPGRNGDLLIDNNRYTNVDISYTVIFYDDDIEMNLSSLKAYLLRRKGYCRLEDTYHPDEYYLATYDGNIEPEVIMNGKTMAKVTLKFTRKPQRYFKQGELATTFTQAGTIFNPTNYDARPFIRVWGYGIVNIGNYKMQIAQHDLPYLDIDCERMDCYYKTINCNNVIAVSPAFPVLEVGKTEVSFSGSITGVEITPRWWTI